MGVVGALLGGALLGGLMGSKSSGGSSGGTTVVQQKAQPAAQPAAPAADSAQQDRAEMTQSESLKKRRGKKGLLVNPLDKSAGGGGVGTGLNI